MTHLKLLALPVLLAIGFASSAFAKDIDLLIRSKPGGTQETLNSMMKESLEKQGYTVNLVNLGSCSALVQYMDKEKTRPGLFITSDIAINESLIKGCDMQPRDQIEVLGVMYARKNTICGPTGTTVESLVNKIKNQSTVLISASTSFPPAMIEAIGPTLGGKTKMVPYGGTGDSIRGMLGGDADFVFGGLTPSLTGKDTLTCVAHSSTDKIDGMVTFEEIFPGFKYAVLESFYFAQGVNMNDALNAELTGAVQKAMSDEAWQKYITKSRMVPADKLQSVTTKTIIDNIQNWQ